MIMVLLGTRSFFISRPLIDQATFIDMEETKIIGKQIWLEISVPIFLCTLPYYFPNSNKKC